MSDENNSKPNFQPILEAPPQTDFPEPSVMENLFSSEELYRITGKLAVLEQVFHLVTKDCSYKDFLRDLLLSVMRVVKSEAGSILEVNQRDNTLFFRAIVGQSSDKLTHFVIPVGKGVVGHVAESKQPLVVNNVEENKVYLKSVQDAVGFDARNLICFPLIIRGKSYGVLELLNRVGEENYTSSDLELMGYLCELLSKAIELRLLIARGAQVGNKDGEAA